MSPCFWSFNYSHPPTTSQANTTTSRHSLNHHAIFFPVLPHAATVFPPLLLSRASSVSLAFLPVQISLAYQVSFQHTAPLKAPPSIHSCHTVFSVWFPPASSQLSTLDLNPFLASAAPQGSMHQTSLWHIHALRSGPNTHTHSWPILYKTQTLAPLDSRLQGPQVRSQPQTLTSYWEKSHTYTHTQARVHTCTRIHTHAHTSMSFFFSWKWKKMSTSNVCFTSLGCRK